MSVARTPGRPLPADFGHEKVAVNGLRLHVVTGGAGAGPAVMLIHGNLSTWYGWRLVLPALAAGHRVVVPDLRGFGDSDRPLRGYDKTTLSEDLLGLLDALDIGEVSLVGHDFGGQIAYRMATLARDRVRRLAVLETLLPGLAVTPFPNPPRAWFEPFNKVPDLPELLVQGREEQYIRYCYREFSFDDGALADDEVREYVRTYGAPGAWRCSFELYRTEDEDLEAFAPEYERKLDCPILALGGAHSFGRRPFESFLQVGVHVEGGEIDRCGHFVPIEQPERCAERLLGFLDAGRDEGHV